MSIILLVETLFSLYTILLFSRIALSWFPSLYKYEATRFVIFLTDPYMNIFRRVLPPINGVLDLSPMLALFSLRFLETIIINIIR
jgi:YggT family protein